jgi:hopanoid-associated phosphorylase
LEAKQRVSTLLVVVGLKREARLVGADTRVLIGGRGLDALMAERPTALLSFGLCGGLDPALKIGDLVLGRAVAVGDDRYDADPAWIDEIARAVPEATIGDIAAGPDIIGTREAKATLREATGALAVDMESHLVAQAAGRLGVPFAVLRAVSDRAGDALSKAAQAGFALNGTSNVAAVARALAVRPHELPSLLRTAFHAEAALRSLKSCVGAIARPALTEPLLAA